jgi:uncharacterized protein (DUF433 family)
MGTNPDQPEVEEARLKARDEGLALEAIVGFRYGETVNERQHAGAVGEDVLFLAARATEPRPLKLSLTETTSSGILRQANTRMEAVMRWEDRITIDPKVLAGKPVIKGTRLAVEFIMDLLAQGWTEGQILENYPGIAREDIEVLKSERVFPLAARS